MACYWMKLPDGKVVHVNAGRSRRQKCACGNPADRECDWCDRPVCSRCSTRRGEVDTCSDHVYEIHERAAIQLADMAPL